MSISRHHLEKDVLFAELEGVEPRRISQPQERLWPNGVEIKGRAPLDEKRDVRWLQPPSREENL